MRHRIVRFYTSVLLLGVRLATACIVVFAGTRKMPGATMTMAWLAVAGLPLPSLSCCFVVAAGLVVALLWVRGYLTRSAAAMLAALCGVLLSIPLHR